MPPAETLETCTENGVRLSRGVLIAIIVAIVIVVVGLFLCVLILCRRHYKLKYSVLQKQNVDLNDTNAMNVSTSHKMKFEGGEGQTESVSSPPSGDAASGSSGSQRAEKQPKRKGFTAATDLFKPRKETATFDLSDDSFQPQSPYSM